MSIFAVVFVQCVPSAAQSCLCSWFIFLCVFHVWSSVFGLRSLFFGRFLWSVWRCDSVSLHEVFHLFVVFLLLFCYFFRDFVILVRDWCDRKCSFRPSFVFIPCACCWAWLAPSCSICQQFSPFLWSVCPQQFAHQWTIIGVLFLV